MKNKPYRPISCDYYDELTLLAIRKTECPIIYQNNGTAATVMAIIRDIYTRNGEEFLLLSNGQEIRLDRIISVNNLELNKYC
ncbi:MAG TPA: hypothetical protein ENJ95_00680 [Bacteroidetes bacterium]|nr:hypothetical protein [Bacteroidota bacterium]